MPHAKKTGKKKVIRKLSYPPARVQEMLGGHPDETSPWRIFKIMTEFVSGFDFLKQYDQAVSIFGSARLDPRSKYYKEAERLANQLAKAGFAVITGGGPGIMEAANKGAFKANGQSVGFNIELPHEQALNKYATKSQGFHYFFVRKVMLAFASEIYIFFPGGFGTVDEFAEIATLVQTKKIKPVPIILVGKDYWQGFLDWVEKTVYEKYQGIDKEDMKIYNLVDDADEAWKLIQTLMKKHKLQRGDIQ
ncbi:MAG: TIGR00730 family Rossman fold protein [Patescibacteria group bacterium]